MSVFEAAKQRRAIKDYDKDHDMPDEDMKKIMTAAHFTPTAFNIQNYRFVVVQNKAFQQQLQKAAWNQEKVGDCSALVILCADKESWQKNPRRYWSTAPDKVQETMEGMIRDYYKGKERVKIDEAHRSCGMAGMTIMLAAEELGYDSCPMDGFDYEAIGELINLPDDHVVSFMIAIGKRRKDPLPRPTMLPREEIVIEEKFTS